MKILVSACCWVDVEEDDVFCPHCGQACMIEEIEEDPPATPKPVNKVISFLHMKTEPNGDRYVDEN